MSEPESEKLLEVAVAAATAAGRHAFHQQSRRREVAAAFAHDVKLRLDLECQQQAEAVIRKSFPDHAVLGEEGSSPAAEAGPTWIVDPLDGTVNFFHGLPLWCSSVAVRSEGRIVAGAVYVPVLKELYTATADGPARCNGELIGVSKADRLSDSLILTGISPQVKRSEDLMNWFMAVVGQARKVRIMGAAAVDICHIACGRADGYFESSIYIWDFAAASLVAQQAGARVEVLEWMDDRRLRCLCTNGRIHEELKSLLVRHLPGAVP